MEIVRIWTGSDYINLDNLDDQVWSRVFHYSFGLCHTFDLSKTDKFKYVSYQQSMRPGIEFVLAENNIWQKFIVMLHTKYDFPDAFQLNGHLGLSFADSLKEGHLIEVRKKISKRDSTRRVPCVQHEHNTLQSIINNKMILDKFQCRIPILYSGQHLDEIIPQNTPDCNKDVTRRAFDFISNNLEKCTQTQTCQNTRFTSWHKVEETWFERKTVVWVAFENPEVEYHHTYICYDLISMIAEIGGILGLTLGASALTLLESFLHRLPFY